MAGSKAAGNTSVAGALPSITSTGYTCCAWVYASSALPDTNRGSFLGLCQEWSSRGAFAFVRSGSTGQFEWNYGVSIGSGLALDHWYFIAISVTTGATWDCTCYVYDYSNSTWYSSVDTGETFTVQDVTLFCRSNVQNGHDSFAYGTIQHFRDWLVPLTEAEIHSESASSTPVKASPYRIVNLSDGSLIDSSGNGHDLSTESGFDAPVASDVSDPVSTVAVTVTSLIDAGAWNPLVDGFVLIDGTWWSIVEVDVMANDVWNTLTT